MKPIGAAERGTGIEVMSDVERGWFVGGIGSNYIAAHVMVVAAFDLSLRALLSGEQNLDKFLIPDSERPELFAIARGVVVAFKNPFDSGRREVTSPSIIELWPRTIQRSIAEAGLVPDSFLGGEEAIS
ncbi:MAG TPA: hypothetical protein VH234_03725 [Candidatus Saccharimonadales bacterium]|jgi:hypothetical protein|nr:hypothetical protein [Candidatus Saccharimonadales bacterium]